MQVKTYKNQKLSSPLSKYNPNELQIKGETWFMTHYVHDTKECAKKWVDEEIQRKKEHNHPTVLFKIRKGKDCDGDSCYLIYQKLL